MSRKHSTCAVLVLLALIALPVSAQENDFESSLRFEWTSAGDTLQGWGGGPVATLHFDNAVVHDGKGAARLERRADSPGNFSSLTKKLPADFEGQWLELRGFLRLEDVDGRAGLWLREDGINGSVQFDNMRDRALSGTSEWTEYSIRLPLDASANEIYFGVLLSGRGTVWADDLQLLVDDKPVGQATKRPRVITILDTDLEFAEGSGLTLTSLTAAQIEHAALLGRIWGFLKYHHPRIAAGELHWDFELFRILPKVLAADDRKTVLRTLAKWIDELGVPEDCRPCAEAPQNAQLLPALDWIDDTAALGEPLRRRLQTIYANRFAGGEQFYVSQVPNVGNPLFPRELPYPTQQPPDAGFRILALLRWWNIIEYWFPYRDLIDDDWPSVLNEFLPRFVAANDWDAYRLELLALIAHVRDTHASFGPQSAVRPPLGECRWPVAVRFVEDRATVAGYSDPVQGPVSGFEIGDVIEALDGEPLATLIESWSPYYCASNRTTQLRDIARALPRGDCGPSAVTLDRRGERITVDTSRLADSGWRPAPHDRPGDTFQLLCPDVAYLKLSGIRRQDVAGFLEQAAGTTGLVIDIRNYPSEFVVFALGSRLVQTATPFALFTIADPANPGAFVWTDVLYLEPEAPGYGGKVAILVDEAAISQAEYTAMALRAGPQAIVIGSQTAGADGNVSQIPLPGGLKAMISGIGVFNPDRTPTQRVGIVPDIVAEPTIDGIREGRDEVLEAALRYLLGPDQDETRIRELARPAGPPRAAESKPSGSRGSVGKAVLDGQ